MKPTEFLADIEAFLVKHGMSPSDFGRRAVGDPNFVQECRDGRSPRLDTVAVVQIFMQRYTRRPQPRRRSAA